MCDDESVSRWMPLMPHPYTLADGEAWVGDAARKWREERWANFAAADPVTGSLMGSCGLRIDEEKESGEIGYLVHRDRRRQGIAAACVALLTDWAFDDLGARPRCGSAPTRATRPRGAPSPPAATDSRGCCGATTWSAASASTMWCTP